MIANIALVLLGATAGAATPCENLISLKLAGTTIIRNMRNTRELAT
jgi:hypothetical protein